MESYNCFSDNNSPFVDDDGFSNFSLRGKKYFARKRAVEAANTRTNELNTLISSPDVIEVTPLPINQPIVLVNPPIAPVNPATLLDTAVIPRDITVKPSPTNQLEPIVAEEKTTISSTTVPNLGTSTSKNNKLVLPSIIGAALLTVVLVVLLKKKK